MQKSRVWHISTWQRFLAALMLLAALLLAGCLFPSGAFGDPEDGAEGGSTRIHFLVFEQYTSTDAIVIESNGRFGIVDSGEDSDYPDGSDDRYPQRYGTTTADGAGHEQEVIAYLKSLGVDSENLEFYIGTHSHSDHIGSADEVIREFHPQRVYLTEYSDDYISSPNTLWDNQYVYDQMLEAVNETEAVLIQGFDLEAPVVPEAPSTVGSPVFTLGDATIEIMNYDDGYKTSQAPDANYFSLGVKVTVDDHTAFLAGDINNLDGDETVLAEQLGKIDLLKLGHHGYKGSNTFDYLDALAPEYAIQTGPLRRLQYETYQSLNTLGIKLYSADICAEAGLDAIIATFGEDGISVTGAIPAGWQMVGQKWHYFDGSGDAATGWNYIDGKWYYFNEDGVMQDGWQNLEDEWYYFEPDNGKMLTGWQKISSSWYYFRPGSGQMLTGWQKISGAWYYLRPEGGQMVSGWQKISGTWYYLKSSGAMAASEWCGGYWLNASGSWTYKYKASWRKDSTGWWYGDSSGWYARSSTQRIDGKSYRFNSRGYWA